MPVTVLDFISLYFPSWEKRNNVSYTSLSLMIWLIFESIEQRTEGFTCLILYVFFLFPNIRQILLNPFLKDE